MNKITLTLEKSGQVLTIQTESPEVNIGEYNIKFNSEVVGKATIAKSGHPKAQSVRKIGFRASSEPDNDDQ